MTSKMTHLVMTTNNDHNYGDVEVAVAVDHDGGCDADDTETVWEAVEDHGTDVKWWLAKYTPAVGYRVRTGGMVMVSDLGAVVDNGPDALIRMLRAEATLAGDDERVCLCARAMRGDSESSESCWNVIRDLGGLAVDREIEIATYNLAYDATAAIIEETRVHASRAPKS